VKNVTSNTFPIGSYQCSHDQFISILQQFPPFENITPPIAIEGPFDGKINSIYLIEPKPQKKLIFRTRVSKAFKYEAIVKEKILYPLLDQSITQDSLHLKELINNLTNQKQGSYLFSPQRPPIVPVQNLHYYYEPLELEQKKNSFISEELLPPNPFPFLLTIKDFLPGRSLFDILKDISKQDYQSPAILAIFEETGKYLAKLHKIQFDAFYDKITDIGSEQKPSWESLFQLQWQKNIKDASQFSAFHEFILPLQRFLKDHLSVIENENEPVLFHNDYQTQNIIIKTNLQKSIQSPNRYQIEGIIDFDNWRIGPRAQDFVKMEYWTLKQNPFWLNSFYQGYSVYHKIDNEFIDRISLYKILWFMLVYSFEMDKIKKQEQNAVVDARFPTAEVYLTQMKRLLSDYW
jgi:aminoglycoside phosphotransferase (APT) family kinase protein